MTNNYPPPPPPPQPAHQPQYQPQYPQYQQPQYQQPQYYGSPTLQPQKKVRTGTLITGLVMLFVGVIMFFVAPMALAPATVGLGKAFDTSYVKVAAGDTAEVEVSSAQTGSWGVYVYGGNAFNAPRTIDPSTGPYPAIRKNVIITSPSGNKENLLTPLTSSYFLSSGSALNEETWLSIADFTVSENGTYKIVNNSDTEVLVGRDFGSSLGNSLTGVLGYGLLALVLVFTGGVLAFAGFVVALVGLLWRKTVTP
jgi:hypothetical protein